MRNITDVWIDISRVQLSHLVPLPFAQCMCDGPQLKWAILGNSPPAVGTKYASENTDCIMNSKSTYFNNAGK